MIENDVAFDPDTLTNILLKYQHNTVDFIGVGPFERDADWVWHKEKCNYECDFNLGTLISFCRISKRLCMKIIELASSGRVSFIEKFIPSICKQEGWAMMRINSEDVSEHYDVISKPEELCNITKLPLHACKNIFD